MNNENFKDVKEDEKIRVDEVVEKEECFVIMPIGDHPSHEKGHFSKIYRDLIKPSIEEAGFKAYRADEGGGSQNIQLDIVKEIIQAPMAICDLSTRNPNVLFELGVRQAFDKPVALIQEEGTEKIFDINTFNTFDYRSERIYDEVLQDRQEMVKLIKTTYKKHKDGDGINSIIRLIPELNNHPAKLSDKNIESNELIKIMFGQMNNLSKEIYNLKKMVQFGDERCESSKIEVNMKAVTSSKVEGIGYNEGTSTLYVRFKNGGAVYAYYGVPKFEYEDFFSGKSVGKKISQIDKVYRYEKIR